MTNEREADISSTESIKAYVAEESAEFTLAFKEFEMMFKLLLNRGRNAAMLALFCVSNEVLDNRKEKQK